MKQLIWIALFLFTAVISVNAQNIAINATGTTADPSAMLDVSSSNSGLLIPRLALTGTASASPVTAPVTSLLVYNTASVSDVTPGYYFWNGSAWVRLYSGALNAWNLTGNSGTNPATNFIGTTDAQDWVIRTNNTERSRILSGGNILFNRTTALYATDLFEAQGNATFPDAINGYTDQATGSAVYGGNSAANGIAIIGQNSTAAGAGTGMGGAFYTNQTAGTAVMATLQSTSYFSACAVSGITVNSLAGGKGIIGACDNATGTGVQGQTAGTDGLGVVGINSAAAGAANGIGVYGQTSQSGNGAAGVWGINNNGTGDAMVGLNSTAAGTGTGSGVYGQTAQSGTGAAGVFAQNTNAAGTALIGYNGATAGTNIGDAIFGQTGQSGGAGAYLMNTHASGTAVMGAGNNIGAQYLTAGSGGAFTGTTYGIAAWKSGALTDNQGAGYFIASTTSNVGVAVAYRSGGTNYKIINIGAFGGSVSTDVWGVNNDRRIMFCPESPEILLQDFGNGQLVNGRATITLDPVFTRNIIVDNDNPLQVYIQLEGDCKGVYVTSKSATGFDVIELQGGTSGATFTWFVSANRADYIHPQTGELISKHQGVRFPIAPEPMETMTKESDVLSVPVKEQPNGIVPAKENPAEIKTK